MRLLLKNCHLIVDDYKEYLDGALIINDQYIEDVFYNSNDLRITDIETIDLKQQILIPSAYQTIDDFLVIDPLSINVKEVILEAKKQNKIIFLGNTKAFLKDISDLQYDGIYRLYENMTPFHHQQEGLVNLAFNNPDKYVVIDPSKINKEVLLFSLNNLRKDRIILIGDEATNYQILKDININLTDVLAMTSLNYYRLYNQKLNGSLLKGKYADLTVLNNDLGIVFKFVKGVLKDA